MTTNTTARALVPGTDTLTQSVKYARHIQKAMLIPENTMRKFFSDLMVLNRPKDVLSGDFYFFAEVQDGCILALADCTGHGVPAALMSMIGYNLLSEAVHVAGLRKPSAILRRVNLGFKRVFCAGTGGDPVRDGMDVMVCFYNTQNGILSFSGAGRDLIYTRNGELTVIKGGRQSIGCTCDQGFTTLKDDFIDVCADDTFVFSTDGYFDQFGGEKKKRMSKRRFYALLKENSSASLNDLSDILTMNLDDWQEAEEQTDDILVLAVRFPEFQEATGR